MKECSQMCPIEDKIIAITVSESVTTGGLLLPDIAQENSLIGEVIAVGPGKFNIDGSRIPMTCKVGDKIIFPKFSALKFEYKDKEYIVLRETDIFLKIGSKEEKKEKKTLIKG